jgi:hypothetical protein
MKSIIKLLKKLSCSHNWEILSDFTHESKFEHDMKIMTDHNVTWEGMFHRQLPWNYAIDSRRKHQTIITCKQCGKVKSYTNTL